MQTALQKSILLHRDIANSMKELGYKIDDLENAYIGESMPLYTVKKGAKKYLGDTSLLGKYRI